MTTHAIQQAAPRRLLSRLLDTPNLPQVIRSLDPRVLHQLVRHCGLEECGEIVALATTEQLTRVFDDDLWGNDAAGAEEQFDADRFGLWLEVLVEVGADVAAGKLAAMDFDFVTASLSRHLLVLDQEMLMPGRAVEMGWTDDDPQMESLTEQALETSVSHELSGYTLVARRGESWDALLSVLASLEHDHHALFASLMKRCCQISTEYIVDNGGLYDVLTAAEQIMDDIAGAREERRDAEGHVTPSQAAAFLKLARSRRQDGPAEPDPVTASYFRNLEQQARARARADRRALPSVAGASAGALEREVAEFLASADARILNDPRRLLGPGPETTVDHLSSIRAQLSFVQEHDGGAYERRTEELAYLANVLVAGCSFQSRRFRAVEAADAVLATCNLGLEHRAGAIRGGLPPDLLMTCDLVSIFRDGWRVLHEDVALFTAGRLVDVLAGLACSDRQVQRQIVELRGRLQTQLAAGTPWRERDNLDVLAILDPPSWAVLLNLVDECPVVPRDAVVATGRPALRVSTEFEFISEYRQIEWVAGFLDSLPGSLAVT